MYAGILPGAGSRRREAAASSRSRVDTIMPIIAYIGLGSNLGDRAANINSAIEFLGEVGRIVKASSLYATEPVGYAEQPEFLNAVVAVETEMIAADLLKACRSIEDRLGRRRTIRWGPRTIDIDILLLGEEIVSLPDLMIPHPRMAERRFVLTPLVEIAPEAVHPLLHKTAAELLRGLEDRHDVNMIDRSPGTT